LRRGQLVEAHVVPQMDALVVVTIDEDDGAEDGLAVVALRQREIELADEMICESSVGPEREHWISQELGDD
jgi:hypothetical protein